MDFLQSFFRIWFGQHGTPSTLLVKGCFVAESNQVWSESAELERPRKQMQSIWSVTGTRSIPMQTALWPCFTADTAGPIRIVYRYYDSVYQHHRYIFWWTLTPNSLQPWHGGNLNTPIYPRHINSSHDIMPRCIAAPLSSLYPYFGGSSKQQVVV